jgi:hypothetical protein
VKYTDPAFALEENPYKKVAAVRKDDFVLIVKNRRTDETVKAEQIGLVVWEQAESESALARTALFVGDCSFQKSYSVSPNQLAKDCSAGKGC